MTTGDDVSARSLEVGRREEESGKKERRRRRRQKGRPEALDHVLLKTPFGFSVKR